MSALPESLRAPHPSRLDRSRPDATAILAAHDEALASGAMGYLDPSTGLFVMTAQTLWDQGSCCERGCRHCPFLVR